jgi:hypothetical protein
MSWQEGTMPPFDGETPGVGVYAQDEPITLTRKAMPAQHPKYSGLLKARLQLLSFEGEWIPKTSGPIYNLLDFIDYLAENDYEGRPFPGWCFASIGYLANHKRLKVSENTIRNYIDRALELGLVEERAGQGPNHGNGPTNLYRLTPKGKFWHAKDGHAIWWRPQGLHARGPKNSPRPPVNTGEGSRPDSANSKTWTQAPNKSQNKSHERTARAPAEKTVARKRYLPDPKHAAKPRILFTSTAENPTAFLDRLKASPTTIRSLRENWMGREGDCYVFRSAGLSATALAALPRLYPDVSFEFRDAPVTGSSPPADGDPEPQHATQSPADPQRDSLLSTLTAWETGSGSPGTAQQGYVPGHAPAAVPDLSPAPEPLQPEIQPQPPAPRSRVPGSSTGAARPEADSWSIPPDPVGDPAPHRFDARSRALAEQVLRERGLMPLRRNRAKAVSPADLEPIRQRVQADGVGQFTGANRSHRGRCRYRSTDNPYASTRNPNSQAQHVETVV